MKIFFGLIVLVGGFFLWVDYTARTMTTANTAPESFEVRGIDHASGRDNIITLGERLENDDIIASRYFFYYYMVRHGLHRSFVAGDYVVQPETLFGVLGQQFARGDVKPIVRAQVRVTFPEGLRTDQMVPIVEEAGFSGARFQSLVEKPTDAIYEAFDFLPRDRSLEGYLFPETYQFYADATEEEVIVRMLSEFATQVPVTLRERAATMGHTLHEVITLASIVEGEVHKSDERPIVAGIFWKRIEIGMPLGSDETIDYINRLSKVKHTLDDIAVDHPYNTYKNAGLPPGPVNNPSRESIMAAFYPEESDYLFFLNNAIEGSVNEGKTIFSTTFEEHIANKARNGL